MRVLHLEGYSQGNENRMEKVGPQEKGVLDVEILISRNEECVCLNINSPSSVSRSLSFEWEMFYHSKYILAARF